MLRSAGLQSGRRNDHLDEPGLVVRRVPGQDFADPPCGPGVFGNHVEVAPSAGSG